MESAASATTLAGTGSLAGISALTAHSRNSGVHRVDAEKETPFERTQPLKIRGTLQNHVAEMVSV